MNRQQKEDVVKQLKDDFCGSQALFVVDYRGLSVTQMQGLRKELRAKGGSLKVAKIRLMKRAAADQDSAELLIPYLKDQLALVFSKEEAPAVAKVLYDFSKDNEQLRLIAGTLDSELLTQEQITTIAKLPSREILLASVLGSLEAPTAQLILGLNAPMAELITVLQKMSEKKE